MLINVLVKSRMREDKVDVDSVNNLYLVYTRKSPIKGQANDALIKIIAKHFGVPQSRVVIKSGFKSKRKTIEIT